MRRQSLRTGWSRRDFLRTCGAVTLGFVVYERALARGVDVLAAAATTSRGFGDLVADPARLIDLPHGFTATVVARFGDEMDDGLIVPAMPDAMATFPGPDRTTLIVCNHEALHGAEGPFGEDHTRLSRIPASKVYDLGVGLTPCPGGTTTIVWDTRAKKKLRQFLSLAGTVRNCAGGATPWDSWLSCEETVLTAGYKEEEKIHLQHDHGYCFEVPASAQIGLADPVPLTAMGRFMREAVAVDPRTGVVYQTEDRDDGLIYRFIPSRRGDLRAGGTLQALAITGVHDTRNWPESTDWIPVGKRLRVHWVDLDTPDAPHDDLRARGREQGACVFARAEGMWMGKDEVYFVCTAGGRDQIGQIFRYHPGRDEGTRREKPGRLELFAEPNDASRVENPDNLVVAPWGDVILCEDKWGGAARLVGLTPDGATYTLALARVGGEFAGATFSPDGSTLFVNLQQEAVTLAITGPWEKRA